MRRSRMHPSDNLGKDALAEMFFTQRLILVEGLEDIAYISSWLSLSDRLTDFRKAGCHLVPVDGKSELLRPAIIAQHMEIPFHVVFDADGDKLAKKEHKELHERDNRSLLRLLGGDVNTLFPENIVWGDKFSMWPTDLGSIVSAELADSIGANEFEKVKNSAHSRFGHGSGLKKNSMLIAAMFAFAADAGAKSPSLDTQCQKLIQFGCAIA